ncbi:MAG: type II secretion system GspH family protein [Candidatus Omnitrophica bacterium]|nr:type II secretion system GspH family protein [Candidatus Omnitrophota bacterium]
MKKGFTLVEIMIVVAIIALLAAIGIPGLLRARFNAAKSYAQTTLRAISTAYESYAGANNGSYDVTTAALVAADPPYLTKDYSLCTDLAPCQGYSFTCIPAAAGYTCTATPQGALAGKPDSVTYIITTGGLLTP